MIDYFNYVEKTILLEATFHINSSYHNKEK